MAVYFNASRNSCALISYKVLFSRFMYSPNWKLVANWPDLRMVLKQRFAGSNDHQPVCQIVRHPELRTVSFFVDKFRIQPGLFESQGFQWQQCHKVFFPVIGVTKEDSDSQIAERFMEMSFDRFIESLPDLFAQDAHSCPQAWTKRIRVCGVRLFDWPGVKVIRVEDGVEALRCIPDVDFLTKTNESSCQQRDFQVTNRHRKVLYSIYESDYLLGQYSLDGPC